MHPIDSDLVARCRREDAGRAAAHWRTLRAAHTSPSLRTRLGTRLVAVGLRLQARDRRRRVARGRLA